LRSCARPLHHTSNMASLNLEVQVHTTLFPDTGDIPNNKYLPLLVYEGVVNHPDDPEQNAQVFEKLLRENEWHGLWRDTVYPYPHYHSTAHEALGIYRGNATLKFGGESGKEMKVKAGDFCVVPAGVGHMRINASDDFGVVGGYPKGTNADINYGKPEKERPAADHNIELVPVPSTDPLFGAKGHLVNLWSKNESE